MKRRVAVACCAAFALLVASQQPVAAAAATPAPPSRVVDSLSSLHGVLPPTRRAPNDPRHRSTSRTADLRLPPGSRQGQGAWYLVRLAASIRTDAARIRAGSYANLSISLNDRTAVSAELRAVKTHGRLRLVGSSLDLVSGRRPLLATSAGIAVDSVNYAQLSAVRGGDNAVTVRLDTYGQTGITGVRILPQTALLATQERPSTIDVKAPRAVDIPLHKSKPIPITISDTGDDARGVRVIVTGDPSVVDIQNGEQSFGVVASGHARTLRVSVRPHATRASVVQITVDSPGGQVNRQVLIRPVIERSESTSEVIASALFLLPAGLALVWVYRRRSRPV
jgi:hypothetical protein